jgi:N12 class adenine-specific DNA methylase
VDVNNAIARSNYEQLKGIGVTALEHLNVARIGIDNLIKIEQHTFRGANNTDSLSGKLDQIITNTKPAPKGQSWESISG